jgi:hypothetical protein
VSVEELKKELASLSADQQAEVAAFLFQLRRKSDPEYQGAVQRRLADKECSHWLTPQDVDRHLTEN